MSTTWKKQWNSWVARTRFPGVYRRRDGGHLVRARVTLPNGDRPEIKETYRDTQADTEAYERLLAAKRQLLEAYREAVSSPSPAPSLQVATESPAMSTAMVLAAPLQLVRSSESLLVPSSTAPVTVQELEAVLVRHSKRVTGKSFSEFAREVAERRAVNGNNATPASRDKFGDIVNHLVHGTTVLDDASNVVVCCEGLGRFQLEDVTAPEIETWKARVAEALVKTGFYAPTTVNGWIATLKSIMTEATFLYRLPRNEASFIKPFSTEAHVTYTRERPNALRPVQAYHFVRLLRAVFPQHYAMAYLMLYTGLRPCNIRPLRRKGLESDIDWKTGQLRVARSQTRGQVSEWEVRPVTKQGTSYSVQLPPPVIAVLEWHVQTQLVTGKMKHSDLLFPSVHGSWRSPSVLDKPFDEISKRMKLGFRLTPRGLRRTFNDLARRAKVDRSVTRSISGHLTEEMQELYETVGEDETCRALKKMVTLVENSRSPGNGARSRPSIGEGRLKTLIEQLSQLLVGMQDHVNDDDTQDAADEPLAAE